MRNAIAIAGVLCILPLVAAARTNEPNYYDMLLGCQRDNFNNPGNALENWGGYPDGPLAQGTQARTLYCDWSPADMTTLAGWLSAQSGTYGVDYGVDFCVVGVNWEASDPTVNAKVETFISGNDWDPNEHCDGEPVLNNGACHSYADTDGINTVPWSDAAGTPVSDFWACPVGHLNTEAIEGLTASVLPGDYVLNVATLDQDLVNDLVSVRNDTKIRGLRCWSELAKANKVYARGQWGCPGAVSPRLGLWVGAPPPPRVPGDVHDVGQAGYGCVDGADYTTWADHYNTTGNPPNSQGGWSVGNFTEDDIVDGADYTVWADHYLEGCGVAAVPEPCSALLILLAAPAILRRARR